MKQVSILITSLLLSSIIYSQSFFENGYIINNDGTKIACFIEGDDLKYNPDKVIYKIIEGQEPVTATLDQISEFSVDNIVFQRFKVKIDTSTQEMKGLTKNREPEFKEQTVFLKLIVDGNAKLYSYKTDNSEYFYFNINNTSIEPLVYKRYQIFSSNGKSKTIGFNHSFKQQLWMALKNDKLTDSDAQKLNYNENSLAKYIRKYNSYEDPNYSNIYYVGNGFESGYIIDNNGNIISCLIKNKDWKNTPKKIEYKLLGRKTQLNATVDSILGFSVGDMTYIRFIVKIDTSSNGLDHLSYKKSPEFKIDTLFLKLLIDGIAKLYLYNKENYNRYFFSVNDNPVEQLVYKRYKLVITGNENIQRSAGSYSVNHISYNESYKQQLWLSLKCDKMTDKDAKKLTYSAKSLAKFFTKYNYCINR